MTSVLRKDRASISATQRSSNAENGAAPPRPSSITSPRSPRSAVPGPRLKSVCSTPPTRAPNLAGLTPFADDHVVVSRCVDVDQAAFVVNGHVDEPIAPGVHDSSRAQGKRRAAKGVEHGAVE